MSDARLTVKVRIQPLADLPESQPAPAPLSRPRIFMALFVMAALLFGAYTLWQSTFGATSSLMEQRELANEGDEATAADSAETTPATSESVAQSAQAPETSTPAVAVDAVPTTTVATLPPSDAAVASQHESAPRDTLNSNSSSSSSPSETDSKAAPMPQQATPATLPETMQAPAEDTRPAVANSALTPAVTAPAKATYAANSANLPDGFSRIVLTAQMESLQPGEPLGPVIAFPNVKRLYLFTEVKGYAGQVLTHRWYYKNQLHTEATLTIEDSPWRTYSENWLLDDQLGDWHVEIVDQAQKLLYRYDFRYQ